jgi:hypothetical protein
VPTRRRTEGEDPEPVRRGDQRSPVNAQAVYGWTPVEQATWDPTLHGLPWRTITGAEPDAMKVARPVVCPAKAGVFSRRETYQGKSQSPVARRAGGRETNLLKPLDSLICGMGASLQAVAQANAQGAPKVSSPGGRACNRKGEGSMGRRRLADATAHSGGVGATAWGQGHAKQLERPAASRCEIGGSKVGCITGPPGNQLKTRGGRRGP